MLRFRLLSAITFVSSLSVNLAFLATTHLYPQQRAHPSSTSVMSSTSAPDFTLDPSETAVVLIEYQNEFCSPGGKLHDAVVECMAHTNMLDNSRRLVQAARSAGCTILHCPIDFTPGHPEIGGRKSGPYGVLAGIKEGGAFTAGEWGAGFVTGMEPVAGVDLVVKGKSGLCGFASTNLEFLLGQCGAKNVVLGGFLTNCCVESTMR